MKRKSLQRVVVFNQDGRTVDFDAIYNKNTGRGYVRQFSRVGTATIVGDRVSFPWRVARPVIHLMELSGRRVTYEPV